MNPSISSTTPITPADRVVPTPPVARTQPADAPAATSEVSTMIDAIPSSPPDEVLDAIGAASNRYDELAAKGQHVGFNLVADGEGRMTVQIKDLQGNVISPPLAPSSVFDILDGKSH
jgi:hypothetical protein